MKKVLLASTLLLILVAAFPTLQIEVVTSSLSEVALIEVSATSPHVANGTDFSEVVVTAKDAYGNPVVGANISLYLSDGEDSIWTFTPTDNRDGTYGVLINHTESGKFNLAAVDLTTGLTGNAQVIFESGPITDIFMAYTKPRESESKNTSEVIAVPRDIFGNTILPDKANITIITDLGTASPTTFEMGAFRTNVMSGELGFANVTAIDIITGINRTIVVPFPAMYIGPPDVLVLIGSSFSVPFYVFVSDLGRALGFYDLNISFNRSTIEFVNATDGDPIDEFDTPLIDVISNNTIRISQINAVSNVTPTGEVNICNITFCANEPGFAPINMTLWNDSAQSLLGTNGTPLPSTPNISEDPVVHKKKKEICLKIHVVKNCVAWASVNAGIQYAKRVFEGANARANCCAIEIKTVVEGDIDPINIDELEEIDLGGEKVNEDDPKDNKLSDGTRTLLSINPKPNCVNIYYVKRLKDPALPSGLSAVATTADKEHFPSEQNHGIVIAQNAPTRTFAHELGHFLIKYPYNRRFNEHNIQNGTGATPNRLPPKNILAQSNRASATKPEDEDLWKDQCEKMMAHDFGDAPDPKYRSYQKNNGACHFNSLYEWLGKACDDELDSRQVDGDRDDGVKIEGDLVPGGHLVLIITISTSGETGRYDLNDKNKVMYLNAWIDWKCNGDWRDVGENIISSMKFAGPVFLALSFSIPDWVKAPCETWLRVRLDYAENVGALANKQRWTDRSLDQEIGQARYGEVEDYKIKILLPPAIPPNAKFTPPDGAVFYVCDDVILDGSASTDGFDALPCPGHICPITEWKWDIDIGNDGSIDFTLYGETSSFHCDGPGPVGITLTVTAPDPTSPTAPDYVDHDSEKHVIMQLVPAAIDVYTEKGGQGPLGWSDAYGPQEEVRVYAKVTYKDEPVENKPVAFEMTDPNGTSIDYRSASTNASGIAKVCFRIPWEGSNAEDLFGVWSIVGTVDISEVTVTDTVKFKLGWIVEITQVKTVDNHGNPKTTFTKGEDAYLKLTVQNIAFTSKMATITIVIYDECGVPIGQVTLHNLVILPVGIEISISLQIPKWAYVGTAKGFGNAYTDLPSQGGTPTCPEKSTTFIITH